jgi:PAS domain S-box-containing protein
LEDRADIVAALDDARAQFFLNTTLLATAAFSNVDQRSSFRDKYAQNRPVPISRLAEARAEMDALGENDDVAALDEIAASVVELQQQTDAAMDLATDAGPETVLQMAAQYVPSLWPRFELIQTQANQIARVQQTKLADVRAAADRASETTLGLLIGLGVATFLVAFTALVAFSVALVRPLASLKANARAVTSGNWEARAKVGGLEETSSLARDLNEMTETLVKGSAQLKESENRFRDVLEVSRDLIYKLNLETRTYDYISPSCFDLLGFTPAEATAMGLEEVRNRFHPEDRQRFGSFAHDANGNAAADREVLGIEYRWKRKDGEYTWLSDDRAFVRDGDGKLLAVVGTVHDVTNRKLAENALRESEERFRTLSASAPIGIFLLDERGETVFVNERLRAVIGMSSEGGVARELAEAVHPDDRREVLTEWAKADRERREFLGEYRILTQQGETRWVRMHVSRLPAAAGAEEGGVVGTIEDITAQKAAEEEMERRIEVESAVARASNLLAASDDIDAALHLVVRVLGEAFGTERAQIFLLQGKSHMHCVGEWHSPEAEECQDLSDYDAAALPWSRQKALQAEPIIVNDVDMLPPEATAERSLWQSLGVRSVVGVSLNSGGRIVGAFVMYKTQSACIWREEDVRLMRLASESISSFIERQRAAAEKHNAYESMVLLLATAAEARDPYTENHLHRIKHYSEAMALEIGFSPEEAQEIGLAALLHDLGKIRVPDSILTKPGALSEDEWQIMRKHPKWGEELLPAEPGFKTARQIARWHHENWDGTGYPDGLYGDMIPLCTAIVSVADGFDAMTSRRPYKAAWPPVWAMQEITKNRGKKYSPAVVDAFMRAVAKGEIDRIVKGRRKGSSDLTRAA